MKLIFERSQPDRFNAMLPELDVPEFKIPEELSRKRELRLPEVAQPDVSRHYT